MRAAIVLQAYIHTYRHTDPSREWALLEGGEERGGELECYRHTYALTKQVLEGQLFIKRLKRKYCLKKKN